MRKKNKEMVKEVETLRSWKNLPDFFKYGHVVAVLIFIGTNWTFQFASELCFVTVEPTEAAKYPFTDEGNIVLAVWSIGFIYFYIYSRSLKAKAKENIVRDRQMSTPATPQKFENISSREELLINPTTLNRKSKKKKIESESDNTKDNTLNDDEGKPVETNEEEPKKAEKEEKKPDDLYESALSI